MRVVPRSTVSRVVVRVERKGLCSKKCIARGCWPRLILVREGDVLHDEPAAATRVKLRTKAYGHPLLMEGDV